MVKKVRFMGESDTNTVLRAVDLKLMGLYRNLPLTYYWLYRKSFSSLMNENKKVVTVLDLGCGDGSATEKLALHPNFHVTGVDIFKPYLDVARASGVYSRVVHKDIRKYNSKSKFDIVVASHVLEHLTKKEGIKFLKKLESLSKKLIIVATPIGDIPQDDTDDNKYQIHRSAWTVSEMQNLGYGVHSQGFRALWGESNIVKKYGLFSFFFFMFSYLLSPILLFRPEWGTYMICLKTLRKR